MVIPFPETNILAPEHGLLEDDPASFWVLAYFQRLLLLVSGRVDCYYVKGHLWGPPFPKLRRQFRHPPVEFLEFGVVHDGFTSMVVAKGRSIHNFYKPRDPPAWHHLFVEGKTTSDDSACAMLQDPWFCFCCCTSIAFYDMSHKHDQNV